MNLPNKIPLRPIAITVTIILSILVEISPVFSEHYEKPIRVIYALIALIITARFENHINNRKFVSAILLLIGTLKKMRETILISPEVVQEMMKNITQQFSLVLDQSSFLSSHNEGVITEEIGSLECGICSKKHLTDVYGKCESCRLSSTFWKKLDQSW
jgi:hypothetical protein